MRASTIYLAKLLGLFTVVVVAWMMLDRAEGLALVDALFAQPALQLTYAMIALGGGLAMVLGHNLWRGPALTIVVTVVGWLVLLKGLVLLFAPGPRMVSALQAAGFANLYVPALAIPLLLGLYLVFAGFAARPEGTGRP
jgi:hypothetical protein